MDDQKEDDVFLTVAELSKRIKFSRQSLYNMIFKGEFTAGKHYLKPRPKKILFIWPAIKEWLENPSRNFGPNTQLAQNSVTKPKSLINI